MQHADIAMYDAKASAFRIAVYDGGRDTHSRENLALISALPHAIETGQLELHFQPQVDTDTRRMVGAEALVRWRHPDPRKDHAGRVHPDGRAGRARPSADPLGAHRGAHRVPLVARRRPPPPGRRQRDRRRPARRRPARRDNGRAGPARPARHGAHRRGHRDVGVARSGARRRRPRRAPRARRGRRTGRLRDRLLVADVPQGAAGHGGQDRPLVRRPHGHRSRRRGDRRIDHRARTRPRADRRRRGHRGRDDLASAGRSEVRARQGYHFSRPLPAPAFADFLLAAGDSTPIEPLPGFVAVVGEKAKAVGPPSRAPLHVRSTIGPADEAGAESRTTGRRGSAVGARCLETADLA